MLDPTVQDYVRAFMELDREAFCQQVGMPVLVRLRVENPHTFQQAATHLFDDFETLPGGENSACAALDHQSSVIEMRKPDAEGRIQLTLGRSEDNDLVILDETVSAKHATFFIDSSGDCMLQDLESTNGTSINRTLLVPGRAVELKDGDVLTFGDTTCLFFSPGGFWEEIRQKIVEPAD